VGREGGAAEALRQCFESLEVTEDLSGVLSRPEAERAAAVVVEFAAMPAAKLIDILKKGDHRPAVVVYAPDDLSTDDERRLRLGVFGGLVRLARNADQLIEQTSQLLHQPFDALSEPAKVKLAQSRTMDPILAGRKVLVIDDDIRNIFSLASALEDHGVEFVYAESGRGGVDLLDATPDVDVVLVDIMMPDMDGYEAIREIRSRPQFADLPVVAVTAKAMKGDRQKCIQAGASDYVSKPVDIDHLVSVLRVSVQKSDARRLASEPVTPRIPQVV
jgi:CheY-like chemotaxis protein